MHGIIKRETVRSIVFFSCLIFIFYISREIYYGSRKPFSTLMANINGHTGPLKPPLKYETLEGFFMQSDPSTDPETFDLRENNFGLINRTYTGDPPHKPFETIWPAGDVAYEYPYTDWERYSMYLKHLRDTERSRGRMYKLLILARHGEGFHNVAEAFYGTKAWDEKWSKLEGNGTIEWADARLTELGETQAKNVGVLLWHMMNSKADGNYGSVSDFSKGKMPMPTGFYVSPLMRCLRTADLTWDMATRHFNNRDPIRPLIKEKLREAMGEHTCDRRSNKIVIHAAYPEWPIEEGFTGKDELWQADHRETHDEHDVRTRELLDDIFINDEGLMLSFTAHSGMISSILRVTGHRDIRLPTGGIMPLFVRAVEA